jgi:hypothetical protein
MSEINDIAAPPVEEWTFRESEEGVVYCLGRNTLASTQEAVAVYERMPAGQGSKSSLEDDATYNRIMYHGFPEEDEKLLKLQPHIRESIIGNLCLKDHCLYINPCNMAAKSAVYSSVEHWLNRNDAATAPFREALEKACITVAGLGISLSDIELYGGASYGLVGNPKKRVDDVDLLLNITSAELHEAASELITDYSWSEIDPQSVLSSRRMLLKAKRWSTSQVRLYDPELLSIDLKAKRISEKPTLWDDFSDAAELMPYEGTLTVVDDSETFCISPGIRCEDETGTERTVLFRGYPYIGCAIRGDSIKVKGMSSEDNGVVLVTQSSQDLLIPDFSKVPID